ncbi:multidrug ABC transporter ATP-binding protein [Candidatus Marsarchaeota G2 archaeon ECH_B_SAG-G16]|uniref:Multidrug ABC transporter ATP-binding protein n=4 Tax=Candidatus Marsarchaeota TaxID=1978152 RepID=A0A2R6ABM2_9ARCH|nr:MAG: multidrug ABC transporter ATP-binding protein [Candidatus Marsarchaeota G1 archaeon OSP_D]PSN87730.1 MAG: multidrug ABC transporter ATP-binding protein [Candidatus Marsarchaeota G1 archaeon OSP_B]PSN88601.1 MAG: multidrug ABC transporter ATP-binding protein [Candidatus Marsarchaeota G1 archaeon OSP_C]PSO04881.1 MAG: multidrug ABC transporter ATP-binding protein [Candidatus Marsarchaeota G2 archaeon ECH_B_SAG-G16]
MFCIEVENVSKSYGQKLALNSVSFRIPCGEKWCLLGPNGAGKTTTLKLLVGLLKPDSGRIRVGGYDPTSQEARALLGYLPEDATPYLTLSVRENLEYIGALRQVENLTHRVDEIIDYLGLNEFEKSKVGTLSRGNRQKLAIALAVLHRPKILLLDEPLNYLDIPTQERVVSLFRSMQDTTFLVSTHIMSIAQRLTNSAIVLVQGRVVWSGSIPELRAMGSEDEPIESVVARLMTGG